MAQVLIFNYSEGFRALGLQSGHVQDGLMAMIGVMMASNVHRNLRQSCNPPSKLKN